MDSVTIEITADFISDSNRLNLDIYCEIHKNHQPLTSVHNNITAHVVDSTKCTKYDSALN